MARIRSIKPEFWTSEQIAECSRDARLLFIGLWNFCDDEGRHPLALRAIKMQVFPGDDLKPEDIHRMLGELSANGLIEFYTVDDKQFLRVTGWKHQKIDHPQKPKYPPPPKDRSPNTHRTLAPDRIGEDRIGEEGKGRERKERTPPNPLASEGGQRELVQEGQKTATSVPEPQKPRLNPRTLGTNPRAVAWAEECLEDAKRLAELKRKVIAKLRADAEQQQPSNAGAAQ